MDGLDPGRGERADAELAIGGVLEPLDWHLSDEFACLGLTHRLARGGDRRSEVALALQRAVDRHDRARCRAELKPFADVGVLAPRRGRSDMLGHDLDDTQGTHGITAT